ncbi:MAG: DUF1080 domain-containing protein [Bacteroidota bacterium]
MTRIYLIALIGLLSVTTAYTQTVNAKVDDLLSKFPAPTPAELMENMIALNKLGETGYSNLISRLSPPGTGNNAAIEYAVGGFSAYATQKGQDNARKMSVKALGKSLNKLTDPQNKSFVISQFELVGKDDAVPLLQNYLEDQFLADPAARALVKINTPLSKAALLKALPKTTGNAQLAIIKALGDAKYKAAVPMINSLAKSGDKNTVKMALYALSYLADPSSEAIFSDLAEQAGYKYEPTNAVGAYLVYAGQLSQADNKKMAGEIGRKILGKTTNADLVGTRTNALNLLVGVNSSNASSYLPEAEKSGSLQYFASAVKLASPFLTGENASLWTAKLDLAKIKQADLLPEQRLLRLRATMDNSADVGIKLEVLREAANIQLFNTVAFSGKYLDDNSLQKEAANTLIKVALAGAYQGSIVKELLNKALQVLKVSNAAVPEDAVKKYIAQMPAGEGFLSLFNGKDLTGWKGLVDDPIKRSKMDAATLAAAQSKADAEMRESWKVVNGELQFMSHGNNLATVKQYGDFEMLVDWKIIDDKKGEGDAGIYLRGTPQVQMWDNARVNVGAQVGSGGLYNNQVNPSKPLKVADNKLDEWNTFRIIMKGDRVTVYLNGVLVTDNVILENYWNRNLPIFAKEQIELQAHGSPVAYRDIYVKELSEPKPFELSAKEKREGYKILFDGTNMFNWRGNTTEYITENGVMAMTPKPGKGGGGNLYTKEEFSDFVLRFEFQLTPGANNGLGIRTPLEGDAAYVGMELQILDNEAPMYKDLHEYQYHGSVYGTIAAKRGYLKPVGEWNYQEVYVKGPKIKVVLNGTTILNGDITEARKNGAPDKQQHPGLMRDSGHIGFLGHGSPLKFKNIRIKDLSKSKK